MRSGVSLVEVLVSTVLLAVGVAGCLAAMQVAAHLRLEAAARESVALSAAGRLAWFEARGCAVPDTVVLVAPPDAERWVITRDSTSSQLDGHATRRVGARAVALTLVARRRCP
jgi:hypothetical protein